MPDPVFQVGNSTSCSASPSHLQFHTGCLLQASCLAASPFSCLVARKDCRTAIMPTCRVPALFQTFQRPEKHVQDCFLGFIIEMEGCLDYSKRYPEIFVLLVGGHVDSEEVQALLPHGALYRHTIGMEPNPRGIWRSDIHDPSGSSALSLKVCFSKALCTLLPCAGWLLSKALVSTIYVPSHSCGN